ncbi:hypothetical protein [Halalkalibacter oceani]|uniref:hypothetical protein n=1 Tax=Halalkalibacter oceani TaxID=1653776 RepID=UPI003397BBE2
MNTSYVWTLIINKQSKKIEPDKITVFQQCTLVECVEKTSAERYLLYFYHNQFLTALPQPTAEPGTFLDLAERRGLHVEQAAPFFSLLADPSETLHADGLPQLLPRLKRSLPPEETALIFSYFDHALTPKELENSLKDLFFSYRRNGQLNNAFRLATLLRLRGYKQDWLHATIIHPDYTKAAELYQAPLTSLLDTDPLYVEQKAFIRYIKKQDDNLLTALYKKQKNTLNLLVLQTDSYKQNPSEEALATLITAYQSSFNAQDCLHCLLALTESVPAESGLHAHVFHFLTEQNEYDKAIELLLTHSFLLSKQELMQLPDIWRQLTAVPDNLLSKKVSKRLFKLLRGHPAVLERIIQLSLPVLLQRYQLKELHDWLKNAKHATLQPLEQRLAQVLRLEEEADNQLELGRFYFEFEQYEKAIDCFSWDMELRPDESAPLEWLVKTYQKLGKHEEAAAYQQLLGQLKA